ncbi:MAG TPA: transglutaminase-like domain-containing protein [Thermoanaerobaculia bacterium]|nr:transglutaminase-like domain-containing protein [Thermoanaerobaculia bacterium]
MSESIYIHPAEARRRFKEFAQNEIDGSNIAYGALLIALEDYPQIDVDGYLRQLDELADRASARVRPGEPAIFLLGHLQGEMFDIDGYHGDTVDYYDPRNACLNEVIDRKAGLPITLSVVFLHVASRIGLEAIGVGLPGHYLVKVQCELNEIYVDPFRGGTTVTVREIGELISEMSGGKIVLKSEHLRGWGGRETLMRILANLQGMYTRTGEQRKATAAQERMEILQIAGMSN